VHSIAASVDVGLGRGIEGPATGIRCRRRCWTRSGHSHLFKTDVQRGDSAVQFGVPELASADEVEGFWPQRIMVCLDLKRRTT
jgi:hypothetical protein